ncbi:hypothetical protein, variant 3 [Aphanomyces astaci]|nr:hypothetical protein, variant 3 [Aphanomyces astaci]ETV88869.1 hypothetical protein, variant 3 [Aphanomyces astaci]|eukprot:XP_009821269.1 hypothetical protein, variant 3 [Aphanomyces astaci]
MTSLRYLHEAALLKNLYDRWIASDRQPYTSMSNVLIAVNPLRYLKKVEKAVFVSQSLDKSPPHPYNVAENAYRQLRTVKQNQSIIISGESGSGKTETSKIILDFLTERSQFTGGRALLSSTLRTSRSNQDDEDYDDEEGRPHPGLAHSLGDRLMKTIPILESFGNAKTHRNHNSSRFGKYMRLQFSPDVDLSSTALHLTGASIDTYLLETSRVVHPPTGERNFHVFYELLRSGDAKLLNDLKLIPNPYMPKDPRLSNCDAWLDMYHYLNRSGCTHSEFLNDRANFQKLKDALVFAGIDAVQLLQIVAGVLHLGNVTFHEEDTAEGLTAAIHREGDAPNASIDVVADLLGIKADDLIDALLKKKIERTKGSFQRRGSVYFVGKTKQQAAYSRDTVAKMIYNQVFSALMVQCADILEYNAALQDELAYIGVLDIFGFEDFHPKNQNSFEQLLINYANEALQSMFNLCILKAEQELYQAENIWAPQNASLLFPFAPRPVDGLDGAFNIAHAPNDKTITYDDNRQCLTLIADRRDGILSILNMAGRLVGQSDRKFNEKLHVAFKKHPCFVVPHPRDAPYMFCIKHYAGVVRYHIDGFIDKNNNVASPQFHELIAGSTRSLLNMSCMSKTPPGSVSEMFTHQMKGLVVELDSTRSNFIRCIKPNAAMDARVFDRRSVLDQLRCSGTIQACKVLQVGLPTRVSYEELVFIYSDLLGASFMERFHGRDRLFTQALCHVLDFPSDAFRLGDTRLFFKTGKIHLLDTVLAVTTPCPPATLQARLISYLAKSRWISAVTKTVVLRACDELFWSCRQGRCVVVLQCWFRQHLAKRVVAKRRTTVRLSRKWNLLLQKTQVRAAFDRSVQDKLELLSVLLRHQTLPPHAKWLLTWLGPMQRAMYVRKLGRAACMAYLAKRAFMALLDKVRRERAAVRLQTQFRRVLAVSRFQNLVNRHRALARWSRIRLAMKVNMCVLAMYRRAHVIGLERDVARLTLEANEFDLVKACLVEKVTSLESLVSSWPLKQAAFDVTCSDFAMQVTALTSEVAAKDAEVIDMGRRFEIVQAQLDRSVDAQHELDKHVHRLQDENTTWMQRSTALELQVADLNNMLALSKARYATLVVETDARRDSFATQVDAVETKMNDIKHDVRLKAAQISELEEYNAELKHEHESVVTQLEDLEQLHEREMATQRRQVTALTSDVDELRLRLAAATEEIERRIMGAVELDTIRHGLEEDISTLADQRNAMANVNAALNGDVTRLKACVASAQNDIASFERKHKQLQLDLDDATATIDYQSIQLAEVEGIKAQYKAKDAELKAQSDLQVASLTTHLHQVQAQLSQALAAVALHEKSALEFERFKEQSAVDHITLKQNVINMTNYVGDCKRKEVALDAALTDRDAQIQELTRQHQLDELRVKELMGALETTQHALKTKAAAVEELEELRRQLMQVHTSLTEELNAIKHDQTISKQVEADLDGQLAESSHRVVELCAQLQHMQLRFDQVQDHIAVKDVVVLAEETIKLQLQVDNDVLTQKVDASKLAISQVRANELALTSQLSAQTIEMQALACRLETSEAACKDATWQIEFLQSKIDDAQATAAALAETKAQLQARVVVFEKANPPESTEPSSVDTPWISNSHDHITTLTAELLTIQHQLSQAKNQADTTTANAPELEALQHQMTLNTLTLTEKMATLVQASGEAKQRQTQLEAQVADGLRQVQVLTSQLEHAHDKWRQAENQLAATLANERNAPASDVSDQFPRSPSQVHLEGQSSSVVPLISDLEVAHAEVAPSNDLIASTQQREDELDGRLAACTDHVYAQEAHLSHPMATFDTAETSKPTADAKDEQLSDLAKSRTIPNEEQSTFNLDDQSEVEESPLTSTTVVTIASPRGVQTNTGFRTTDASVSQIARHKQVQVNLNKENRVAALEARLKVLELQHELNQTETSRAHECIANLKSTIEDKDHIIVELRSRLAMDELNDGGQVAVGTQGGEAESPTSMFARPTSGEHFHAACYQLEMEARRQQQLNRRLRKVVLQTRW